MDILKEIVIIIISIMAAASYSAALIIGMNRTGKRDEGKLLYLLLYSIKIHILLFFELLAFLAFLLFNY